MMNGDTLARLSGGGVWIYRVQRADGRGPWIPGFSENWIDEAAPVGRLAETIMDLVPIDVLRRLPGDRYYGCGCRSIAELRAWFTARERRTLGRFGFAPAVVRVDGLVAESAAQALAWRWSSFAAGSVDVRAVDWLGAVMPRAGR